MMLKHINGLLVTAMLASPSLAETFSVDDFDTNKDKLLSRAERTQMRQTLAPHGTSDSAVALMAALDKREAELRNPDFLSTADIVAAAWPAPQECDLTQPLFLRDSLMNVELLECRENREKSGGAAFSFSDDYENGGSSATLKGVVGYVLIPPGTTRKPADQRTGNQVIDDVVLAAFAEVNGTLDFKGDKEGYARFGVEAEARTKGIFDQTIWDFVGYYQPDIAFDTHSYGGELRFTPIYANAYLNSYRKEKDSKRKFFFQVTGIADSFFVASAPSDSRIADENEYLWLGGRFGAVFEDAFKGLPNGYRIAAETLQFWDALSGKTTNHYSAGVDVFLNEKQTTAIGVSFNSGTERQTLEREEIFKANLKVKY